MSRLDELINELCPDGVEYRKLGEIGKVSMCRRILKSETNPNEGVPFYKIGTFGGKPNAYISFEKFNEYKNKYSFPNKGDILISAAGTIGKAVVYDGEPAYYQDSNIVWLAHDENKILNKFLFYCYQMKPWHVSTGGTISRLYNDNIANAVVPLPPLPVQSEIVRILDKFTELTSLLSAELTARRKQYEYYRDKLLTFGDGVEYRKLGEIATVTRGGSLQKKDFIKEGYPCIHYGQIYTHYGLYTDKTISFISDECASKQKKAVKNDIIMAVTSENIEDVCKCVAWLGDSEVAVSGHSAIIHHNMNAKFLAYYFHTEMFFKQKLKLIHGTKVIEVTPKTLLNVEIPLPPLPVQARIVSILDRFDSLCNDITAGLPAEIASREKQYSYYRDRLLSFKRRAK